MTDPRTGREPSLPIADDVTGREPFIGGEASIAQALLQLGDTDMASTDVLVARLAGALPQLAALLHDEDERKRSQAARLIGMVAAGHPPSRGQSVPLLVGILDEAIQRRDWLSASTTIDYLGGTAHPLAAEALSKVLHSDFDITFRLSERTHAALVRLGMIAVPVLIHDASQGFGQDYLGTRYSYLINAITSICQANPEAAPQVTEWLTLWIIDGRIKPSYEIGKLIRQLRPTNWIEPMIAIASNHTADVPTRLHAVSVLRRIGDPQATPLMFDLLEEDDHRLHWYAMSTLRTIRVREDIPKIVGLIHHPNPRVRRCGMSIAGSRKLKAAIPAILEALSDGQEATRRYAVGALYRIRDGSTVPALCGMIADRAKPVRREMVRILMGLHGYFPEHQQAIIAALRTASNDPDEQIRRAAEFALHHLGVPLEAS